MSTLITQQRSDLAHSSDWAFKQLFKLESECRSQTPAMQVKAIGRFPKLLDQFPFPTLVSSAFLKLGDLFRSSPNSMRYHIAQVFESSRHHLVQITHTEELLKRVISVLYSNDPIARVLALRLVGNASILFAKYPEAQHGVLLRYQSTHPLEIAAAVQTTELMLKYSPELLKIVWETVIAKASDQCVPDPVRAQLIHSLQHAASNLQLSARLYDYCRTWVCTPENTTIVKTAALGTWKEIIQPHNELKLKDAVTIAGCISHSVNAISKASLSLLAKWRHGIQSTAGISNSTDMSTIKQQLNEYIKAQFGHAVAVADLRCIRLVVTTLARMETAPEYADIPKSWELVEAICGLSLNVLRGDAPSTTTVLGYMQNGSLDANMCDADGAKLRAPIDRANALLQQAKAPFQTLSSAVQDRSGRQVYCAFVRSVMVAVNVASILKEASIRQAATNIVASAWCTIAQLQGPLYETNYTKQFLNVTWKWCKSVNTATTISESFYAHMAAYNCLIFDALLLAICSDSNLSERMARGCVSNIKQFVISLESSNVPQQCNPALFWKSIVVVLTYRTRLLDSGSSVNANDGCAQLASDAIVRWAQHMMPPNDGSRVYSVLFDQLGPSAHLCRKLMSLLSSCGDWLALAHFCKVLQLSKLSNRLHEWINAICFLADAESKSGNISIYQDLTDRSLCILRTLNNQTGIQTLLQQFLIQLRKEFISIIDAWKRVCSTDTVRPSHRFIIKSLSERTYSLSDQADYVSSSFVCVDKVTRSWIDSMQSSIGNIVRVLASPNRDDDQNPPMILDISKDINLYIGQCDSLKFVVGPSFFFKQTNPEISIETRPDLEGTSTTVVFSGSQFHFTVEGFVRFPVDRMAVPLRRVNVSVWLSRHSFGEGSPYDLQLCTHFNNIAWNNNCASQIGDDHLSATEDDSTAWSTIWNNATVFSANIDSTYFACPCAIAIPSLHSLFGHVDTNMSAHVHVACALVDSSDRTWYAGPHKSYPLTISTTAKS
ncbi:hypothetical protein LPJ59_001496 [Coemansia sp. RSA 2399]|nr:hypothetical protein LPJ59_001496 [Coemansia sp. RSA 2399]